MKAKERQAGLVSLQLAKQDDVPAVSSLLFEWLKFEKEGRLQQIRRAIKAREIIVSMDKKTDKVVGFIHGIIHNDPISCGPLLYITALYIRAPFRRRGIGSLMVKQITQKALEDHRIVGVEITTAHWDALKLYKKLGFSQFKADFGEILLNLDIKKWKEKLLSV